MIYIWLIRIIKINNVSSEVLIESIITKNSKLTVVIRIRYMNIPIWKWNIPIGIYDKLLNDKS